MRDKRREGGGREGGREEGRKEGRKEGRNEGRKRGKEREVTEVYKSIYIMAGTRILIRWVTQSLNKASVPKLYS